MEKYILLSLNYPCFPFLFGALAYTSSVRPLAAVWSGFSLLANTLLRECQNKSGRYVNVYLQGQKISLCSATVFLVYTRMII